MERLRKQFEAHDMTVGEPRKGILRFAIPLIIGTFAQQLYNTVDSMVVGRYIGDLALSSVGASSPVLNLLMVLFMGMASGVGIMVSQYYGGKRKEDLAYTIGNCITMTIIVSLITTVFSYLITDKVLTFLKTPVNIHAGASLYLRIIFLGLPGIAYYNILSGMLRGLGDSASSLLYLIISTCINIFLDIFFVTRFKMGIDGVAWATVCAQTISAILCFHRLNQMTSEFALTKEHYKMRKKYLKRMISLGLPSGAMQAVFSLSAMATQSLTNQFGEMFVAANLMVMRVDGFAMMPNFSFGMAMTTFTGQNVGAGKMDRLQKGLRQGITLALTVAAMTTGTILIFGGKLMSLFTKTEALAVYSWKMMFILAPGYLAFAITQCLNGTMRGAGDTLTPMIISIINTIGIRVPLAYIMAYFTRSEEYPIGRPETMFISLVIAWVMGAVISYIAYNKGRWRKQAKEAL